MKNLVFVKLMFCVSIVCTLLFAGLYCYGTNNCDTFAQLLDITLPFCLLSFLSLVGFGTATLLCKAENKSTAKYAKCRTVMPKPAKKIDYNRRFIIKTYERNGCVSKKQINLRGDYGVLKSA